VVTKCKFELTEDEANKIRKEIHPLQEQQLYFSSIQYGNPYHIINQTPFELDANTEVLLVTGIASPQPLKKLLEEKCHTYQLMSFSDHYIFRIDDLRDIRRRFDRIEASKKIVLTTEKDAMRLMKFRNELGKLPLYVIPISHHFLFDEEMKFIETVTTFIKHFKPAEFKEAVESPDLEVSHDD
jgi:tetraacyldisaccharide 4'-kinase